MELKRICFFRIVSKVILDGLRKVAVMSTTMKATSPEKAVTVGDITECGNFHIKTKRGHAPNGHAPFGIRETNSAMKHHYMMLICLEVFGSSFATILGSSMVRTPLSTFALMDSLSTSSGRISVCWNFV